jgi:hypothetical protein
VAYTFSRIRHQLNHLRKRLGLRLIRHLEPPSYVPEPKETPSVERSKQQRSTVKRYNKP